MRSLELQRPMIRATNTGATAVIDHHGVVTHALPPFTRRHPRGHGRGPAGADAVRRVGRALRPLAALGDRPGRSSASPLAVAGRPLKSFDRHRGARRPCLRRQEPRRDALVPANHPAPAVVLGRARLRAAPALRHGGRCRHEPHRDLPARARPRAVEGRLRAAEPAPQGRPLRREPEPAAALLPVPGGAQAGAGRHPRPLPRLARGARLRPEDATTSASSRTTGRTRRSAPGASAGRSG